MKFGDPMRTCPEMSMPTMPPSDRRVGGDALEADLRHAVLAERILLAVGAPARPRERNSLTKRRSEHFVQPADEAVRPQEVATPGRRDVPSSMPPRKPGTNRVRSV